MRSAILLELAELRVHTRDSGRWVGLAEDVRQLTRAAVRAVGKSLHAHYSAALIDNQRSPTSRTSHLA